MKFLVLAICFSLLNLQACNTKQDVECNANLLTEQISTTPIISSETAKIIAKGYLTFDYNLKNYSITVLENPDSWEVRFVGEGPINEGTGPVVYINKINGERIYIVHSK